MPRIGTGFDIHKLVAGRRLLLGGVEIPHDRGLLGHSDGDALCHSVADSILGAMAAGDIGMWFPPDDPSFKDANSLSLLKQVVESAKGNGYRIGNIDCVIICERPKLASFFPQIRSSLSQAMGCEISQVSVKARTMEGMGDIGKGEAIAVQSVVILE